MPNPEAALCHDEQVLHLVGVMIKCMDEPGLFDGQLFIPEPEQDDTGVGETSAND